MSGEDATILVVDDVPANLRLLEAILAPPRLRRRLTPRPRRASFRQAGLKQ